MELITCTLTTHIVEHAVVLTSLNSSNVALRLNQRVDGIKQRSGRASLCSHPHNQTDFFQNHSVDQWDKNSLACQNDASQTHKLITAAAKYAASLSYAMSHSGREKHPVSLLLQVIAIL